MQMSEREIVGSFNRADDKKEQLAILAQLNACEEDQIKAILEKNGIDESVIVNSKRRRKRVPKEKDPEPEKVVEIHTEEPASGEDKPFQIVPQLVRDLVIHRVEELRTEIAEKQAEIDTYKEFLAGTVNGYD